MSYLPQPLPDALMIEGILTGNHRILSTLEDYFKRRIYGLVTKNGTSWKTLTRTRQINEVYVETFARVKEKLQMDNYEDQGKFPAFFMSIAKYVNIEFYKTMKKETEWIRKWQDLNRPDQSDSNDLDLLLEKETEMIDADFVFLLEACIKELSDDERALIDAHYWGGQKLVDMAIAQGIARNTMNVRVCRIRQKLSKRFFEKLKDFEA